MRLFRRLSPGCAHPGGSLLLLLTLLGAPSLRAQAATGHLTPSAAAKAAMAALPLDRVEHREFGGLVYRLPDGRYGATPGQEGSSISCDPEKDVEGVPMEAVELVGTYHTHPLEGTWDVVVLKGRLVRVLARKVNRPSESGLRPHFSDLALARSYLSPPGSGQRVLLVTFSVHEFPWADNERQVHFVACPEQIRAGKVVPFTGEGALAEE